MSQPFCPDASYRSVLPAEPSSASIAREAASELLRGCPRELVDTVTLLASELVTNAILHTGAPLELRIVVGSPAGVRIEVSDGVPEPPVLDGGGDGEEGQRGLLLTDALAAQWGWEPRPAGKTVWCEVAMGQPQPGHQ